MPAALISAPLYYRYVDLTINGVHHHGIDLGAWHVDTLPEALLLVPIGVVVLIAGLHLANVFARFSGILAAALLDDAGAAAPAQPSATPPQTPGAPEQVTPPQTADAPQPPRPPESTGAPQQSFGGPPSAPPQAPASPASQDSAPQAPRPAPLPPVPPQAAGAPEARQ